MESAIEIAFQIAVLIFSVVIHEVSHGYAALLLGDRTALYAGRLTLNPIKHIDFIGSIIVPIFTMGRFGWAKPVPYNPFNLRNQKWGPAIVGVAGPGANIAVALFFGIIVRLLSGFSDSTSGLFILNLITIASSFVFLNFILAFFNLIPVPPLDGSKLVFSVLPYRYSYIQSFLERYGFFIVIILVFPLGRWFLPIVFTPVQFFFQLTTGMPISL